MGNVSSVREEGSNNQTGVGDEEEVQFHEQGGQQPMEETTHDGGHIGYQPHGESEELMVQSLPPPHSPTAFSSPLMFNPQVPMVPLTKSDEMPISSNACVQNATNYEDGVCEQGIPTMITWSFGGKEVAVEGSWDNWKSKMPLQRSGKDFTIVKVLPSGFYHYRFIVDGEWRYAPDFPWAHDDMGNAYNFLDLQDYVPEDLESISGFEPPQSPESSYTNSHLGLEDYTKEPPLVPPHLQTTLLNVPPSCIDNHSLSRPQHVALNHLYVHKGQSSPSVVAFGSTHRFLAKYVTVVLYKPLQR